MTCGNIHVDDIGVTFTFTITEDCVALNISAATSKVLFFQKPSGATVTKTATFLTTGADGDIYYLIVAGDLDEAGIWSVQAEVEFGSNSYHSETKKFKVLPNLG